jgi:hypothetical protein
MHVRQEEERLEILFSLTLLLCVSKKKTSREFRFFYILIHLKSFFVCFTSSYINVKKRRRIKQRRKTDGSSDHRDKKVVCVCLNLELAQIIDFTQSCLIDISGIVRGFFFCCYLYSTFFSLHSRHFTIVLLANISDENDKDGCNNCFSMRVCVRLEKLKVVFSHRFSFLLSLSLSLFRN